MLVFLKNGTGMKKILFCKGSKSNIDLVGQTKDFEYHLGSSGGSGGGEILE